MKMTRILFALTIAACFALGATAQAQEKVLLRLKAQPGKILKYSVKAGGAVKIHIEDLKTEFAKDFITPALWAHARYEGRYPLATALGRPLIAKHLVEIAEKEGAEYVSHGCTGKGNDQVRLEVGVKTLNPSLKVIAPLRDWEFKTREEEIEYAKDRGIPVDATKKSPYSIDKNIWGCAIEAGILEDAWKEQLLSVPDGKLLDVKIPERGLIYTNSQ